MTRSSMSVPGRVVSVLGCLVVGYVAVKIGVTGELKTRTGEVVRLPGAWQVVLTGLLAALSVGMAWVAFTGRED